MNELVTTVVFHLDEKAKNEFTIQIQEIRDLIKRFRDICEEHKSIEVRKQVLGELRQIRQDVFNLVLEIESRYK